mgnify:CR=1 FL=1
MRLAIIDYGAGNLRSVSKAVAHLGVEPNLTSSARDLLAADAAILPGVGAAGDTMRSLTRLELVEPIRQFVASGRPFFGVCLGLQVLFTVSEEGGAQRCLDLIPGTVRRLPAGLKVPHMGWNQVRQVVRHPLFTGIPDGAYFYFVHSYFCQPSDPGMTIGETEYGLTFCSVLAADNVVATQFHPEKSGHNGLQIYRNFLTLAGLGRG